MMMENGEIPRGQGGAILQDDHHSREDLRMIAECLRKGWLKPWELPEHLARQLPNDVADVLRKAKETGDGRVALRAADVLCRMAEGNLRLAEAIDKVERLDDGRPTENAHHELRIEFEQRPDLPRRVEEVQSGNGQRRPDDG